MKTLHWLWALTLNKDSVWVNTNNPQDKHVDKMRRFGDHYLTWWSLRPLWILNFATRRKDCRCRFRIITGHQTIYCQTHCGFDLDADDD